MNLTKLEKAVIIILVVGGILAAGIFIFIVPAYNKIGVAEKNLKSMQQRQAELEEKLSREATIDKEISDAQADAEKLEVNFYPDLKTYETVEIVLAYLKKCNLNTESISVSSLGTNELRLSVYEPIPVTYDLKEFSKIARGKDENALLAGEFLDGGKKYTVTATSVNDITIADKETGEAVEPSKYSSTMKMVKKQALCKYAVDNNVSQVVGCSTASFSVTGTYADYLSFIDYIFDLDRATMMNSVVIPMTASEEEIRETYSTDADGNLSVEQNKTSSTVAITDDTEVEQAITLMFFSVDPMKALDTITVADEKIVVNQ